MIGTKMDPSYDDKFIRRLEEHNVTLKVNNKPCSGCVSSTILVTETTYMTLFPSTSIVILST